jgi:signal transduction histidine kinase
MDTQEAAQETAELKRQLDRSAADLKAAKEEMQHFVYAVSHDLRAPLRGIFSSAQLLQRQHAQDEQSKELTSFILESANEMNLLVEDLLKYSRVGGSPRLTTVKLDAVAQWAWMNLQSQARETGAEMTHGELPEVNVDESQFVQLFQQLFSNALKFRGEATPRIRVTCEERAGDYLIAVEDNGPGIEPKYHEVVFTPLKRLHAKTIPGTGLGLAICRKIVRAHGGEIWVESDGKHGSVFKFTVPF